MLKNFPENDEKERMKHLLIILISLNSFAGEVIRPDRVAKIYAIGKTDEPPVYIHTTHYEKNDAGQTVSSVTIKDTKGETVFTEVGVYDGAKLIAQKIDQFQTGEHFDIHLDDSKIHYDKSTQENIGDGVISGPTLESYLLSHWDELLNGDTIRTRLLVPERKETFGFKFWVREHMKVGDRDVVKIGMKPRSIIVAAFFGKTINLYFDVKDKAFIRFEGRTTLKIKRGDNYEPFDAEITY